MDNLDSSSVGREVGQFSECYIPHRVPPEIIRQICAQFCLHCYSPGMFRDLHADDLHGQEYYHHRIVNSGRADLQSLSQTCRALRAQVSPFFYHLVLPNYGPDAGPWFIKAILQTPQMAPEVRFVDFRLRMIHALRIPSLAKLLQETSQRLGLDRDISQLTHQDGRLPIADYLKTDEGEARVFKALVFFILASCRSIDQVNLCLDNYDLTKEFNMQLSLHEPTLTQPFVLHSLRTLTVRTKRHVLGESMIWYLSDIANILKAAPRLEILHCVECLGVCRPGLGDEEAVDAQVQSMIGRLWCRSLKELWITNRNCKSLAASLDPTPSRSTTMGATILQLLIQGKFENLEKLVIPAGWWDHKQIVDFNNDPDMRASTWDTFYKSIVHLVDAKRDGVAFASLKEISIPEFQEWAALSWLQYLNLRARVHERGIELTKIHSNGEPSIHPWA